MATFVYITATGDDLIRAYEMDASGRLTHRRDTPVRGGPAALACVADRQILYCSLRASRELAAFRLDGAGALQQIGRQALDADACYLTPDKTGRYLLSAYYGAGKAAVHELESDGRVGRLVCALPTADRAHCIETDASNRYAFVPHPLDANCVVQLRFDARSGQLTPNPFAARVDAGAGEGPRHFVFSRDQRFVYTSNEDGSSVTAYQFDGPAARAAPERGTLHALQTVSTLPEGFSGGNTCAQIHLHPSGRALYVSNRGHDSIAVFALDNDTGMMRPQGWRQTEAVPRVFNIDPSGRFLLAAGQGTGRAAAYAIAQDSGALTPLAVYEIGERPMWVLFLRHA